MTTTISTPSSIVNTKIDNTKSKDYDTCHKSNDCKLNTYWDEITLSYRLPIIDISPACKQKHYYAIELQSGETSAQINMSDYTKLSIFSASTDDIYGFIHIHFHDYCKTINIMDAIQSPGMLCICDYIILEVMTDFKGIVVVQG